jgi:uncharacterized protein YbaR (Trm112 family)
MHKSTLNLLACPSCRCGYEAVSHAELDDRVLSGFLRCPSCAVVIPIIESFVLFTEPLLDAALATPEALRELAAALYGSAESFDDYRHEKRARDVLEPYAAFHPFNESTRVLLPLLPHVTPLLREGDHVLDTWARTGWSGEWLAGLLPAQRIVSIWEGNSSVMAYRGYRHLLGAGQRAPNLDVIFSHPERPLPFRDNAFALLYALDSLHRYSLYPFASECQRVTREDGALIHAHLHLSNSEPEPFFERGCHQAHGRHYRAWLDRVCADGARRGYVFSEATLFDGPEIAVLADDCETTHYNALAAILPPVAAPIPLAAPGPAWRYVVNPLFKFNLGRHHAKVAPALHGGAVEHLLLRHPVYAARLPHGAYPLDDAKLLLILLSLAGATQAELLAVAPSQATALAATLAELCEHELLFAAPISAAAHALQRFHANQFSDHEDSALSMLRSRLQGNDSAILILDDGTALSGADLADFAARIPAFLRARGVGVGDWIAIAAGTEPLLWLAGFAAAAAGVNVYFGAENPAQLFKLHLQSDSAPPQPGRLALGLAGGEGDDTLLAALATLDYNAGSGDASGVTGRFEFPLGEGDASCNAGAFFAACAGLGAQLEPQTWILSGNGGLPDLLAVAIALLRGERLHFAHHTRVD